MAAASSGSENRVALVTGAGAPRIGNVVARTLAARGYRVILHARHSAAEAQATVEQLRQAGAQAGAVTADLTDEASVAAMSREALALFGRIDALVNCAAVWISKTLEETTAADVRLHLESNALATFLCCQHVGLAMAAQPSGGAIVNLGDWAIVRPYLNYSAYFPSKGAIPALTRTFAVELAHRNPRVRVNAVLPGPAMMPESLPADQRQAAIAGTLVKRAGSPQHVADAVSFLLENDFITGVCLPVDGGRTIYCGLGE